MVVVLAFISSLLLATTVTGFQSTQLKNVRIGTETSLAAATSSENGRRDFCRSLLLLGGSSLLLPSNPAQASVFLDPAMYGDQELRVAAVYSLREKVRESILQRPELAPAFFQMSLLDGLSYNIKTRQFGPDGRVVRSIFGSKNDDPYTTALKDAATVLVQASISLKKYTAITIGDAVAISGAEAIESIGGPYLGVQLGRLEPAKNVPLPNTVPLNLFDGTASPREVSAAFEAAGLTGREMVALLTALFTLEAVEKTRSPGDWKASAKPKYRERGKMGRMSDFKRLTDEDIAALEDEDFYEEDPDEGFYIAESFGTRKEAFGRRIEGEIDEKTFNTFVKELNTVSRKKGGEVVDGGYIEAVLLDRSNPTLQSWLNKYAGSNLSYLKDLGVAYNAVTQLGAEYTGGKYESLLKNKPRKSLNDDDLDLF
eukprot:CAMPEP_0116578424 /NCGR_PEP_ID=MMETSP0397-20121206/21699_1 /TAXON_ID=216820 /ORGANISM="Cyclophora tenuis, Strain ECT3854" /LENGTH=426 /DNA_ID=CAMNT_0004107813 /DNA_START=64 /DNA_END=1344 /DNA_ORIENTATION=+